MSAFGRARRSVYLDGALVNLLRTAAPHETWKLDPHDEDKSVRCSVMHTTETLLDQIVREYFDRPDKSQYAELLRMQNEAEAQAFAKWKEAMAKRTQPSSNAEPPSPSNPAARESD